MKLILRWGRSAYERDEDLALEERLLRDLGVSVIRHPTPDVPAEALSRVDGLVVTSGVSVSSEVLSRLAGDSVLTTTSGYDHIDMEAARRLDKRVARLADARRDSVVECALGMAIELMRRHPAQYALAREGVWARGALPALAPVGLSGSTVAVVGMGVIGRRMSEALHFLGARVIGVDPLGTPAGVEQTSLEDALERADLLTLHCGLTKRNRGMLGSEELDRMRETAVLVNTARGPLLDVDSAVERVRTGRLRGLGVDVFPEEPYPKLREYGSIQGILLTPHAAGFTHDLGSRVAHGVVRAVAAWSRGEEADFPVYR